MNILEKVGERIRVARKKQQISSTELAEKIGMSKQLITNWEKGRRLPTIESIISLSDTLNAPVAFLLGINDYLEDPKERTFSLKGLDDLNDNIGVENINVPVQFVDKNSEFIVVRLRDDSMEVLFRKNDLAIIHLDSEVSDGNYVLLKINKTNQTLFRKYIIDNTDPAYPQIKLVALNNKHPAINFDSNVITILGVCKDNLRMIG